MIALPLLLVALGATGARGATTGITGGPNCGPIPTFQTRECGSSGEFLAPATIGNTPTEWTKCIKKKCEPPCSTVATRREVAAGAAGGVHGGG